LITLFVQVISGVALGCAVVCGPGGCVPEAGPLEIGRCGPCVDGGRGSTPGVKPLCGAPLWMGQVAACEALRMRVFCGAKPKGFGAAVREAGKPYGT
jgi:hypothetical protein